MMFKIISLLTVIATTTITITTLSVVDAQQQCVPYQSPYTFPAGQYPDNWKKPTASVFNTPEFKAINNSINWSLVPNIPPKQMNAQGAFISTTYPATDPDCWWTYKNCVTPKAKGLNPDASICPQPVTLGLTFDDGPNCTDSILYDFLKTNNQKATMFYIGSNVANWPKEAQRGLADGHQICVHTWSHPYMTTLTNQEVLGELYYTRKAITYVLGVTPLCWRPPFGDVDDRVRAIAQQLNMSTILWDQDTDDWEMVPAGNQPQSYVDARYQNIVNSGTNGTYATHGTIILSHELNSGTISEAISWYPKMKAAYKNVVPVASCLNIAHPYAEANITYPSFDQITAGGGANSSASGSSPVSSASSALYTPSSSTANSLGKSAVVGTMVILAIYSLF